MSAENPAKTPTSPARVLPTAVPLGPDGMPLVMVSCAATELVPHVQFGNVTIGPVVVTRFVPDGTDEELVEQGRRVQRIAETICAAERRLVQYAKGQGPQPTV